MSTVKDYRLFKVRELIEKSGGGTNFAIRLGVTKPYISRIAGQGTGRKGIGDATARRIEREFSLPVGYLDSPPAQEQEQIDQHTIKVRLLQVAGSNENCEMATYKHDAVSAIQFFRPWIRQNVNVSNHERLGIATVRDDKMNPTFTRDDLVLIDVSVSRIEEAGIYVFEMGRILYINRVQPTQSGIKVLSDNKNYATETFSEVEVNTLTVHGKVLKAMNWKSC